MRAASFTRVAILLLCCVATAACIPRGAFIPHQVPPTLPESPGITVVKVDQSHQGLDNKNKMVSYTVPVDGGLLVDLGNHKNERFKGVPDTATEVLQVMDGHRIYSVDLRGQKKRRYVVLPKREFFMSKEILIMVGFVDPDKKSIKSYPTWVGHAIVDPKFSQ